MDNEVMRIFKSYQSSVGQMQLETAALLTLAHEMAALNRMLARLVRCAEAVSQDAQSSLEPQEKST
jgi:hypothetical protein